MGLKDVKNGKLLYHLTKLDNLDSICKNGLLSRKSLEDIKCKFLDIADSDIIAKRRELGILDLIPFHFHPYSAFDIAVKNSYKDDIFIYICLLRKYAKSMNFKILPIHPLSNESSKVYGYSVGFDLIDWESMSTLNNDNEHIKCVKMAECLANSPLYLNDYVQIYVPREEVKDMVVNILRSYGFAPPPPYVTIRPEWFVKKR